MHKHSLAVLALVLALCAPARAANDSFVINGLPFITAVPGGYLPAFAAYFPNGLGTTTPMSVANGFPPTNSPVTGTFGASGVSATFTPSSPAAFNIFLGAGAGAIHLEKRIASTGTWSIIDAAGTQLYTWTTFSAAFVEQVSEEQYGIEYRLNCTQVTTPISYIIK
ncbi:MAG TPA: hypothetical protein VIE65_22855 [Methylobacter sp.]|jgi:hypothetical protein